MPQEQIEEQPKNLVRAIGRWSLTALMVNIIIGSGIFVLPSTLAGLLGRFSPWAMVAGGLAASVIMACFAEVASYFTTAGGPYLYTREAFGRFVGLQAGWMLWLSRLTAPAANANVFALYLGEFWPHLKNPVSRFLVLTVLIWGLAVVNFLGVRRGTHMSNVFTIAKLLPLLAVGIAGGVFLWTHPHTAAAVSLPAPNMNAWLKAGLLLVFAYGGFDSALVPAGEASNPRKDAAVALFVALLTCMAIYTLTQWVAVGTVSNLAQSERPLAEAARNVLGQAGSVLVAIGALVSVFGYLSANMLAVPRITFALAEQGDFPSIFAAVHSRFRTPYVSIFAFALLTWAFALSGNFAWNVGLSAVARLFYYGACCAALPVLRRKMPGKALFRMPGGPWLAAIAVILCATLLTQVDHGGSLILMVTIVVAALNWLAVRGKGTAQDTF